MERETMHGSAVRCQEPSSPPPDLRPPPATPPPFLPFAALLHRFSLIPPALIGASLSLFPCIIHSLDQYASNSIQIHLFFTWYLITSTNVGARLTSRIVVDAASCLRELH